MPPGLRGWWKTKTIWRVSVGAQSGWPAGPPTRALQRILIGCKDPPTLSFLDNPLVHTLHVSMQPKPLLLLRALVLLLVEKFDTHLLWLLMNWGSLSVLPGFPSLSEMQCLRSSGQTLHPLYLTICSPTCTQPQGLLRQGVTGEKSFHFKSPCFCFPGQTQEISLSGRMVCSPRFWRGKNYCSLFSVQFNPYFPVALTKKKKTSPANMIALADLSKFPHGGWAMTAAATPRSNPIPWAKSKMRQWQGR